MARGSTSPPAKPEVNYVLSHKRKRSRYFQLLGERPRKNMFQIRNACDSGIAVLYALIIQDRDAIVNLDHDQSREPDLNS